MRISDWSSDVCSSDLGSDTDAAGSAGGAASGGAIPSISPASAADIRFDRLPASSAFRPSLAIIGRWFGASPPVTAIWIAIELKFAKPQSAKVAIATAASDMSPCTFPKHRKAAGREREGQYV